MKKIGILGTGMVGNTIGSKLIALGYEVKMGSRTTNNPKAAEWVQKNGKNASQGSFAEAASFGELVFNCTKGEHSLEVMKLAGIQNLAKKILIDISNPLDYSKGIPPILIPELGNNNSLGEELQKMLPETHVIKTLNIVNCEVMVDASKCGGDATMFVAGNDAGAKKITQSLLQQFGWTDILDLGDIRNARSTEMMMPIWLNAYMTLKNGYIGFKIVRS